MNNNEDDEERLLNEKKNPREKANIFSVLSFGYTIPTFKRGWQKDFEEKDLYTTLTSQKSKLLGDLMEKEWNKQLQTKNPSLFKAIKNVFLKSYIKYCIFLATLLTVRMVQSIPLYYLMKYYTPGQTQYTLTDAYLCTGFIVLASFIYASLIHSYLLALQEMGMRIRVGCCSLVYRKSLKLSRKSLRETTIGQMVNLLSNDVNRFDYACIQLPTICVCPYELILAVGLLCIYTGYSAISGVGTILLQIPLQIYLAKRFSKIRLKTALRTDERVRLMSEIVSGIQVIKMYAWEISFEKLVSAARRFEIKQIRASCNIKAFLLSLSIFSSRVAVFVAIMVYVLSGNIPEPEYVFMVVSLFNVIRQSLTVSLPAAIAQIAEAIISVQRLQKFLMYEEIEQEIEQSANNSDVCIVMENATAKWADDMTENTLSNINLTIEKPQLLAVIGLVGSGKSSLLQMILKELPTTSGSVTVTGKLSYASQDPWLFGGTIKQNILFGQILDQKRYNQVIEVCSLRRDILLFPHGDETLIGERGVMLSGGQRARVNLARAIYKEADIYLLDDPLSAVDTYVGKRIFEDCIKTYLKDKCTILITHQIQYLKLIPKIVLLENGEKIFEGEYENLYKYSQDFAKLLKNADKEDGDLKKRVSFFNDLTIFEKPEVSEEKRSTGKVKNIIYKAYLRAGGYMCAIYLVIMFLMTQLLASGCDYFVTFWVNTEQTRENPAENENLLSTDYCIYIYTAVITLTIIVTITRSINFFAYCMRSSTKLHDNMFTRVVRAPMLFFNKNPSGRILNRFSKDIGSIDDQFPFVTLDTIQISLNVVGIVVVTAAVSPLLSLPVFGIFIIFYYLRRVYLKTSRSIKRLEGTTKSPVFTHLSSSLQGLTTIRAFKVQNLLIQEFDRFQDVHSSAWDLFISTSRAFAFVLDTVCCFYILIVGFSFLLFFDEKFGGNVGLAITQTISLTGMFQWGMRQWSEMENTMTSVERVYEYTQIEQEEAKYEKELKDDQWPDAGAIEFKHVYLRYSEDEPFVLKNVNFKIEPKEKIGIVGRTGAGKSSIITSLFQLAETTGEIIIDKVDTQTIALNKLRSHISIIPQEPVLFAGTLRRNLDPFEEYTDDILWSALELVELKSLITETPLGLFSNILEGGSNFSVGQRQLLCLARALIRSNKILVLDEATANVDPYTDSLIQKTIREKFVDCTVLTIAHRLNTILDSDKVLVMDAGKSKEFDTPYNLLQNVEGIFYGMVQQMGKTMADEMIATVNEHHKRKSENASTQ